MFMVILLDIDVELVIRKKEHHTFLFLDLRKGHVTPVMKSQRRKHNRTLFIPFKQ